MTTMTTERVETLYRAWDQVGLDDRANGTVFRFLWQPWAYTYAVLRADGRWWATGNSCNGLATEDVVAWLIGKDVGPDDVTWLS
jgi:hypothetical protein